MAYEELDAEARQMVDLAYAAGNLSWLLEPHQLRFYSMIWDTINRQYGKPAKADDVRSAAVQACRRIGKSFCLTLIALEFAKRYPKTSILFVAPTMSEVRDVIEPILRDITGMLPPEARPFYDSQRTTYKFTNGSSIQIKGVDLHPHRLRGTNRDLIIVDEAAFVHNLRYIMDGILGPMTFRTRGVTIANSTRGVVGANEFNLLWDDLSAIGQASKITVYEAGFSDAMIQAERRRVTPAVWRIEYECEPETDASQMIIPEWQGREREIIESGIGDILVRARQWSKQAEEAKLFWRITSVDFGVSDNTVVLCSVFDFRGHELIPRREWVANGRDVSAQSIALAIRDCEAAVDAELGYAVSAAELPLGLPPWTRVGDHNMQMLQTLAMDYGLSILPVHKPNLENNVNYLRSFLTNPAKPELKLEAAATPNLWACIRTGTWADVASGKAGERKRIFARSGMADVNGKLLHHFDALAALVYTASAARFLCNYEPNVAQLPRGAVVPMSQAHKYVTTGRPGESLFKLKGSKNGGKPVRFS